jgi:Chitin binding Peritrophin-A domain
VQAGCQAFHVCNGDDSPPQSFLCPNGTIFNQEVFACEWWNNVDCSTSESYYAKNSEIGVVIPYKGERTSLLKVQSNAANGDNDINFQPASSNEDENRLYLPPADTPPPTSSRRPTTARPTTPPSTYLPPQTQRATSRPQTQRTTSRPQPPQTQRTTSRPQPPPTISARPTFRPIVVAEFPTNDLQTPQQSDFNNNFQGYDYPKPTSTQRPILPGSSNNFQSFSETDGYDYPKPEAPFSRPETTRRPITTQRPVTTRRPVITTTTRRPVIVSTTTTRRPFNTGQSNNVPSFSEIDGYDYPKPSAGLPLPTTTRLPVTITTRRPVPTITTTRRPVTFATTRRPFVQSTQQPIAPGPSNPLPSFSETDGYSYPKPSVGLPLPTTTRLPVTITTRRPVPTFTTTRRPFIQSTQRPIVPGPSNPLPSFSETDGYNYPKPSSGLPFPTTRQPAPTTTTRRPITTTQRPFNAGSSNEFASFSQTDGYNYPKPSVAFPAPTTTTRRPVTTTQRPIAAGPSNPLPSFSETDGYDYPKPSVGLPAPSTSRRPVTITQRPITAVPSNELPSFSENDGYSYPKPSVGFPSPTPSRQPQTSRPLPSTTRQPQTTRQPYVQPTTQRPIVPGSSELSQNVEGYNYPSPSVSFPTPTRQPVTTTTRRPVSITQRPVTTTFRPITTQRPSSTNYFEETSGYNYPKPVSSFPFQSTVSEIQTTAVNQQFGAGDNQYSFASSSTARPIAPTDAAPEVTIGYNYPQPSAQFELPLNPEPQPSFTAAEGYNSPKPGSPFSVFQRNPQTSDTSANLINQAYQSAPPCIHNQPQNVPAPAPLEPLPNNVLAQEYLPPVSDNEEISHSVSASPSFNLNFNGYQYPKPDTGFVTGKKKPLKNEVLAPFNPAEVLSSNHELSAAQDHVVSTQFTQPFIDGFHSAQQGSVS